MRPRHWLYTVPLRLRSLFLRRRVDRELDDELRFHLENQIEHELARGLAPEEARYAALRAFGGVEQRKEQCRDARRTRVVDELVQDVRYACRTFRRSPGFTAVALITLAIGIGPSVSLFSAVNALFLRPFPGVRESERLVSVHYRPGPGSTSGYHNLAYPEVEVRTARAPAVLRHDRRHRVVDNRAGSRHDREGEGRARDAQLLFCARPPACHRASWTERESRCRHRSSGRHQPSLLDAALRPRPGGGRQVDADRLCRSSRSSA